MTIKGVRVAFLAYTAITNGIPSPHPWAVNRASAAQVLADARRDGAQVVIVNLHWGDEYIAQPSSFQLQLARRLTATPDITAVVGQHVHVVQPIRFIHGKPVVFGEGNLVSVQTTACCRAASLDGMIVLLTITVDSRGARVTVIHYVPIWVRPADFVVLPAGTAWRTDHADAAALRLLPAHGRSRRAQLSHPAHPRPPAINRKRPQRGSAESAGSRGSRRTGSRSVTGARLESRALPPFCSPGVGVKVIALAAPELVAMRGDSTGSA